MSERLKKTLPLLNSLHRSPSRRRKDILRDAPTDLILSICELALNVLRGNIPLTTKQYRVFLTKNKKNGSNYLLIKERPLKEKGKLLINPEDFFCLCSV